MVPRSSEDATQTMPGQLERLLDETARYEMDWLIDWLIDVFHPLSPKSDL